MSRFGARNSAMFLCLATLYACSQPSSAPPKPPTNPAANAPPKALVAADSPEVLVDEWVKADDICRGSDPRQAAEERACKHRRELDRRLAQVGWCYGENAVYGFQYEWRKCGSPRFASHAEAEAEAVTQYAADTQAEEKRKAEAESAGWFVIASQFNECEPIGEAFEGAKTPEDVQKYFARNGLPYQFLRRDENLALLGQGRRLVGMIAMAKTRFTCQFALSKMVEASGR